MVFGTGILFGSLHIVHSNNFPMAFSPALNNAAVDGFQDLYFPRIGF